MRVFLTGATGFIGTAVIPELIANGHTVLGLVRSDAGAASITALGAEVLRGDLEDLDTLRRGASTSDAVIHAGFIHDFANFKHACAVDETAIKTLGEALANSTSTLTERPFLVTSGIGPNNPGTAKTELDPPMPHNAEYPRTSEVTGLAQQRPNVRVNIIRLPQVHDPQKQGLISYLIPIDRKAGASLYVGEGQNAWAACHISDAARLYRLALEKGKPGAAYHAVGEEGVRSRDIAESLSRGLNFPLKSLTPQEAQQQLGFLGFFSSIDMLASSAITKKELDWHPTGPTLIEDLNQAKF